MTVTNIPNTACMSVNGDFVVPQNGHRVSATESFPQSAINFRTAGAAIESFRSQHNKLLAVVRFTRTFNRLHFM